MAKNEYDDIDDLYLDLEKDIQRKVLLDVGSKMKEIMKDTIDEVVFNQYIPSYYKRRKTGAYTGCRGRRPSRCHNRRL